MQCWRDPPSSRIEIEGPIEPQLDLLTGFERLMRIGQRHQHVVAILQVNVILITEMFNAVDAPGKLSATGLGDLQVFGADAERFSAKGHGGMREKVNRQE